MHLGGGWAQAIIAVAPAVTAASVAKGPRRNWKNSDHVS